jgi:2-phospho-L-lactate guanylyltransferase
VSVSLRVVVPFAAERPKTRLEGVFSPAERRAFADAMLTDVLAAVTAVGHEPTVLTTALLDRDVPQIVDERPLGAAVDGVVADAEPDHDRPLAVVMADLALATPAALRRLTVPGSETRDQQTATPADLVFAPGLGGGTNAVVVREPQFRTAYHGASIADHRRVAAQLDARVREVDSRRLATDIDTPDDLAELLLHGDGAAHDWLVDAGFELDTDDGRVGVTRESATHR